MYEFNVMYNNGYKVGILFCLVKMLYESFTDRAS